MRLRGLLNKAKTLAEENLPPEVLDASKRLRDTVLEHAPPAVTEVLERLVQDEDQDQDQDQDQQPRQAAAPENRRADTLQRVKTKAEHGLKPEDSLVVIYATDAERDEVADIEKHFERIDTTVRPMDLDKEPLQTKTQLAKLTGKMVPPYVYINGRYWGALGEMETLDGLGVLEDIVANRLDDLPEEARRIGKIHEVYDDDITVENILDRWKKGHILCVDDLDSWYEVDRDGTEHFYYQGGPHPVETMPDVAAEIVEKFEAEEWEATWHLEASVHIDG